MNFESTTGYYSNQDPSRTPHRFALSDKVFSHARRIAVYYNNSSFVYGFRFLDAGNDEIWRHGSINGLCQNIVVPHNESFVGFKASCEY